MIRPESFRPLLGRGYTVFAVVPGSQPRYQVPEIQNQVNRSVRFIRHHARDYGIDPGRIGVALLGLHDRPLARRGRRGARAESSGPRNTPARPAALTSFACLDNAVRTPADGSIFARYTVSTSYHAVIRDSSMDGASPGMHRHVYKSITSSRDGLPTRRPLRLPVIPGWAIGVLAAEGKMALMMVLGNASSHISQPVRPWHKVHKRRLKAEGLCGSWHFGCRSRTPWLNPIESK